MFTAERLLQTIRRLQDLPEPDGRRLLLNLLRRGSAARRGLLFLIAEEAGQLRLLESSGRLPPCPLPQSEQRRGESAVDLIPLHGLFGSTLREPAARFIPSIQGEPRALPIERYWSSAAERLLLCPLGLAGRSPKALLVLCFTSEPAGQPAAQHDTPASLLKNDLFQSCLLLLASYLPSSFSFTGASADEQANEGRPQKRRSAAAAVAPLAARSLPPGTAIEEERARIAFTLHDGLAQELAHLLHQLEIADSLQESQPEEARRALAEAQQQLRQSLERLRETIATLAPAPLGEISIELALRSLLADFQRAVPTIALEESIEQPLTMPRALEATVFHVVQEALNNVRKHAQASRVKISISTLRREKTLLVSIEDNGKGFAPDRRESSLARQLGLYFMRERVQRAGGSLTIQSAPQQGTHIEARFPLRVAVSPLTARERQILELLSNGASDRAIAQQLALSAEAVRRHIQTILHKLKAHNRTQAVASALRRRWLE
ncbi:hybrid sensor histidine kinase/response regulator transcription factor [Thermogemmatispora sp.]|uniref:helix-turn-helix transcriptional regulator n=1 Tax=Thermogemmatispora sp. TaxID=1968838 RepID=UPI0035E461EF